MKTIKKLRVLNLDLETDEYLRTKDNASEFIRELIRKEMKK